VYYVSARPSASDITRRYKTDQRQIFICIKYRGWFYRTIGISVMGITTDLSIFTPIYDNCKLLYHLLKELKNNRENDGEI
jgi:hypothetical protein